MNEVITFGIVGTGAIADFHARAIEAVPSARLGGVYSRDPAKAAEFASRHGTHAAGNLDELLGDPSLDAICITTPSGTHAEPAIAALRAGKHVLCEKPLEVTSQKLDAMLTEAKKSGRSLAGVFPMRFGPAVRQLKAAIDAGRFGRLALCSCSIRWWRSPSYYQQAAWRGTWELDGGGVLMNQGIHFIDLLRWLAGTPRVVSAHITNTFHDSIEVEDTAAALLRFPSGAIGTIEASTAAWPGNPTRIEISGDKGSAVLENDRIVKWSLQDEAEGDPAIETESSAASFGSGASNPKAISIEGHRLQILDFTTSLLENKAPFVPDVEARATVDLILEIYRSAKTTSA